MAHISRTIRKKKKPWRGAGNSEALLLMSDEDLIEQFQASTVEAFNILVDRYSGILAQRLQKVHFSSWAFCSCTSYKPPLSPVHIYPSNEKYP